MILCILYVSNKKTQLQGFRQKSRQLDSRATRIHRNLRHGLAIWKIWQNPLSWLSWEKHQRKTYNYSLATQLWYDHSPQQMSTWRGVINGKIGCPTGPWNPAFHDHLGSLARLDSTNTPLNLSTFHCACASTIILFGGQIFHDVPNQAPAKRVKIQGLYSPSYGILC